jgi:hypothetical protein
MEQLSSYWKDFHETYREQVLKSASKIQGWLKTDKDILLNILGTGMIHIKDVKKKQSKEAFQLKIAPPRRGPNNLPHTIARQAAHDPK